MQGYLVKKTILALEKRQNGAGSFILVLSQFEQNLF